MGEYLAPVSGLLLTQYRGQGLYLGRPFLTNTDYVQAERPTFYDLYRPPTAWSAHDFSDALATGLAPLYPQGALSDCSVSLFKILSPLGHHLYSRLDASKIELQALAETTFHRLLQWKLEMPAELQLDYQNLASSKCPPQILSLQYAPVEAVYIQIADSAQHAIRTLYDPSAQTVRRQKLYSTLA